MRFLIILILVISFINPFAQTIDNLHALEVCYERSRLSEYDHAPVTGTAPEISAATWFNTNLEKVTLENLRGNIVVVEFWANWCPHCLDFIPHLTSLEKKYREDEVVIIGLTNENHQQAGISQLIEKMDINYIIGTESDTARNYGVTGIPVSFIVDSEGQIVWNGHPINLDETLTKMLSK